MSIRFSQVPHSILLVRPASFGYNPETASSNAFQRHPKDNKKVQQEALVEFDEVINVLSKKNIANIMVEDTSIPETTDAIFPNNWITTHQDGKVVLYPMMAPSRRKERRTDIVDLLKERFQVSEVIDLSDSENQNEFLEGTGSIIFDHPHRVAYACRSDRTNKIQLEKLCQLLNYRPLLFDAVDENDQPIYHTNVMMWIGASVAGICLDSIKSEEQQEAILSQLSSSNHKVIALSYTQMNQFAGNMFEVENATGKRFLLMSQTARDSLLSGQLAEIEKHAEPLPIDIHTIEESGGGSIRCMVAGIHLPKK
ncbi:MAG TPA: arginine deiminase-related protein [Cyclobacteriaceae bacterium]